MSEFRAITAESGHCEGRRYEGGTLIFPHDGHGCSGLMDVRDLDDTIAELFKLRGKLQDSTLPEDAMPSVGDECCRIVVVTVDRRLY
jgi:hypothetical protein